LYFDSRPPAPILFLQPDSTFTEEHLLSAPHQTFASFDKLFPGGLGSGLEEIFTSALRQHWLHGLAVGILRNGQMYVRCYGPGVTPDSQFQLGSLTKTYTAELLALMAADGTVSLDDPAAKYLMPGQPLARAAGKPYPELLRQYLLTPAGLDHTELTLTGQPHAPLLQGHTQAGFSTPAWHFDAYAPCGALQPHVADQLRWLAWLGQHPERLAMTRQHAYTQQHQGKAIPLAIGLGWHLIADDTLAWHSGATYGFSTYFSLNKTTGDGIVLLSNRAASLLVLTLGRKLEAALAGKPVPPLRGGYGLAAARILDPIRLILRPLLRPLAIFPFWLRVAILFGIGLLFDHLPHNWWHHIHF
jgi:CubicO group peptidase (beta-lactamase class C family)